MAFDTFVALKPCARAKSAPACEAKLTCVCRKIVKPNSPTPKTPVTTSGDTIANSIAATPAMATRSRPKKTPNAFDKTINIPLRLDMCDHSKSEAGAAADGPRVTAHFEKLAPVRPNMIESAMRRVHCPVFVPEPSRED